MSGTQPASTLREATEICLARWEALTDEQRAQAHASMAEARRVLTQVVKNPYALLLSEGVPGAYLAAQYSAQGPCGPLFVMLAEQQLRVEAVIELWREFDEARRSALPGRDSDEVERDEFAALLMDRVVDLLGLPTARLLGLDAGTAPHAPIEEPPPADGAEVAPWASLRDLLRARGVLAAHSVDEVVAAVQQWLAQDTTRGVVSAMLGTATVVDAPARTTTPATLQAVTADALATRIALHLIIAAGES